MGVTYDADSRFNLAVDTLIKAIEIDPHYANAWYNLGNTHVHHRDLEKAIDAYQSCVKLDVKGLLKMYQFRS